MLTPFVTRSYNVEPRAYAKAMMWRGFPKRLLIAVLLIGVVIGAGHVAFGPSFTLGVVIPFALFIPVTILLRWITLSRIGKNPKSRQVFETMRTISFDENGAFVKTDSGIESKIPWSGFVAAEVRGDFIFLFMTAIQHLIVPDHAFPSPENRTELIALLTERGLLKVKP